MNKGLALIKSHWRVTHIRINMSITHTETHTNIWHSSALSKWRQFSGNILLKAIKLDHLSIGTPCECNIKSCTLNESILPAPTRVMTVNNFPTETEVGDKEGAAERVVQRVNTPAGCHHIYRAAETWRCVHGGVWLGSGLDSFRMDLHSSYGFPRPEAEIAFPFTLYISSLLFKL